MGESSGRALPRRSSQRSDVGVVRKRISVQVTAEQKALLDAQAHNVGLSVSRLLVDSALRPVNDAALSSSGILEVVEDLRYYRRKLEGATTNLNQIAHHANSVSEVPADFAQVVAGLRNLVGELNAILLETRR